VDQTITGALLLSFRMKANCKSQIIIKPVT